MSESYAIDGIGDVAQRVRRDPNFELAHQRGLTDDHRHLLTRVGGGSRVQDLLTGGSVTPSHAIELLRELIAWGGGLSPGRG